MIIFRLDKSVFITFFKVAFRCKKISDSSACNTFDMSRISKLVSGKLAKRASCAELTLEVFDKFLSFKGRPLTAS